MDFNIHKGFYSFIITTSFFLIWGNILVYTQDSSYTKPKVTNTYKEYKKQVNNDSLKKMVELKTVIPGLIYDLRYASINNFMNRLMYPKNTAVTFLRFPAVKALTNVQAELNKQGMGLKIFDAYRPYAVTVKFWELIKDERYVAHPTKGSGHNRGIAVDLTIINLTTGNELEMGTGFDNFSDTAHHSFTNLSAEVLQNRNLLRNLMEKNNFRIYPEEWWHYSCPMLQNMRYLI
ncbi:MAG: M15 family metallopeptidase [Chitinophagaceae bacterium]|nr:M15 family metallopeptidase [Chitinophagaceae bacterium]